MMIEQTQSTGSASPTGLALHHSGEERPMTLTATLAQLTTETITQEHRLVARLWAGDHGNHPVVVAADPDQPPVRRGQSYYHTTLSGKTIVSHPSAYGYPTLYHASTRRIEVGARWLIQHPISRTRVAGVTMWGLSAEAEYIHGLRITRGWINGTRSILIEGDRDYHASGWEARPAIHEALAAWKKQRAVERERREISANLQRIWVTEEDSIAAGNCPAGTSAVARTISARLEVGDGAIGAVRADYLLRVRRDEYARRAIQVAARRLHIITVMECR